MVRQQYFKDKSYCGYYAVNKIFTRENQTDYRALPAKMAKWVQILVDKNYQSFFALLKNKERKARLPKYLPKDGRQMVFIPKDALSFKSSKLVISPKRINITIKTKQSLDSVQFVRINPKGNHIVVEVGYNVQEKAKANKANPKYASADIGLNNLLAIAGQLAPLLINGRPLKAINQYANKQIAKEQQLLDKGKKTNSSKKENLWFKRNNKINDYLHKASRHVVNYLVSNGIDVFVIGKNTGWKQNIKLGKKNNQHFVQISFNKLIQMITYKCQLVGIDVVLQEESYTSKCSFLDNEPVQKHDIYVGKRIKRGLFKANHGKTINADVNGALNILRKYLSKKEAWNNPLWLDLVEAGSTPNIETWTSSFN